MTHQRGTRLGQYELIELIGAGGMGEVYLARDSSLGRSAAIKVLRGEASRDRGRLRRFETEARAASALSHPHIVTVYGIGEHDGAPYLAMEYVDGPSLARLIEEGLPRPRAIRYGTQIAQGLARAHEAGIVHRDLKPTNVVISRDDYAKILDFGLAKLRTGFAASVDSEASTLEPETHPGALLGTVGYMSPEQARGQPVDFRSDQFSFGVLLFEMTTGVAAFRRDSAAETLGAILKEEPPPLSSMGVEGAEEIESIVRRCLAKDPEDRYPSTQDLVEDMRGLSSGDSGRRRARWPPTGRAQRITAGALALAALLFLLAVWGRPFGGGPSSVVPRESAVAVLPFVNRTGADQLDYLGVGLAADLNSELAALPGRNAVGNLRVWQAVDEDPGIPTLAEDLAVNAVLLGEVHRDPDLRVVVQILGVVDADTTERLWTRSFVASRGDLLSLRDELVDEVARALSASAGEIGGRPTLAGGSSVAYDNYLQGLEWLRSTDNPRHAEFAADLFREASRLDDDVARYHSALGLALTSAMGDPVPERLEEAERAARRALELDPALPDAAYALARALRESGRVAESVAELRRLIARYPTHDGAFRELGGAYAESGDVEAARACFEGATSLNPDGWLNWNDRGAFEAVHGDPAVAFSSLERAVALAPSHIHWPRLNLGGLMAASGDFEGAIAEFEATGATTTDADLASNMATAYFFSGDLARAEELYRRAVELDPDDSVLRRNLGDALLARGSRDQAVREFQAALEHVEDEIARQPDRIDLLAARALYAAKVGECRRALRLGNELRPLLAENWQDHLNVAATFALCGAHELALLELQQCRELGIDGRMLRAQPELASLADDARFLELTAE